MVVGLRGGLKEAKNLAGKILRLIQARGSNYPHERRIIVLHVWTQVFFEDLLNPRTSTSRGRHEKAAEPMRI